MLRLSHVIVSEAIVSSGLYLMHAKPEIGVPVLVGVNLGAQLPDIDHPKTEMARLFGPFSQVFVKAGHRGMTHSLLALSLFVVLWLILPVTGVMMYLLQQLLLGIALGYFLHLLEDDFSRQGVLWFYPLQQYKMSQAGHLYKQRTFHSYYYVTGGKEEAWIRFIGILTLCWSWYLLYGLWFK